jgi:hypothetical protein
VSDHPKLRYKRGVQLDDQITITLPAAEWITFIFWATKIQDGVPRTVGNIVDQLGPQLYDAPSLKAFEAHIDDRPKTLEDLLRAQFPSAAVSVLPGPFTIVCDTCGDRDEYDTLPFAELACGHNGPRHAIQED